MTATITTKRLEPKSAVTLKAGDVFSWGTQTVWFVKKKKGAIAIGPTIGSRKLSEKYLQNLLITDQIAVASTVHVQ